MRSLLEDFRYAIRILRRAPAFAAAAILTLVFGIVLNTAAFGIVNALWFHKLPFRDDQQIMVFHQANPEKGLRAQMSFRDYADLCAQTRSFEGMAAFHDRTFNLSAAGTGRGEPVRVSGGMMSASTLGVLGYTPILGRGFTPEEDGSYSAAYGPPVVIISEGLWRNRFQADPNIIGRDIKVDGGRASIIGVLPYQFRFIYGGHQVLAPLPREVMDAPRTDRSLQVLGRLRRDVPLSRARGELEAISAAMAAQAPASNEGWVIRAAGFRETVFATARRMYPILLAASALVLLIVCANISNLLLAKTTAREREIAIRLSLGARRLRIVRQVITEGLVLAGSGAALALVVATCVSRILIHYYPPLAALHVDYRVFLYTLAVALVAGVAFGLMPALAVSRPDLSESLKAGARNSAWGGHRLRNGLVVGQLAFALVLLFGTALLLRSMAGLRYVDTGFTAKNLLAAQLTLEGARYAKPEQRAQFWRELGARIGGLPGVERAAVVANTPLLSFGVPTRVEVAGRPSRGAGDYVRLVSTVAGAGYVETLGIPLIAGRSIGPADDARAPRVAVLNKELAERLWPGEDVRALTGRRIRTGDDAEWATVVGVIGNARQAFIDSPYPEIMIPAAQSAPASMSIVLRTSGSPRSMADAVRREVRALDPDLPIAEFQTLDDIRAAFYPLVMVTGLGVFAAVALAIAALGLYGVISFVVARRTREFGVRMALGANGGALVRMVVGQGLRLALIGTGIGLLGAFGLAQALRGFLMGIGTSDPFVFGGVAVAMCVLAIAASVVPALRAARVDPMVALRYE